MNRQKNRQNHINHGEVCQTENHISLLDSRALASLNVSNVSRRKIEAQWAVVGPQKEYVPKSVLNGIRSYGILLTLCRLLFCALLLIRIHMLFGFLAESNTYIFAGIIVLSVCELLMYVLVRISSYIFICKGIDLFTRPIITWLFKPYSWVDQVVITCVASVSFYGLYYGKVTTDKPLVVFTILYCLFEIMRFALNGYIREEVRQRLLLELKN